MAHPECSVCKMQHARTAQHMAMIIAIKKAKLFTQQVFNLMALKTASSRGKTSGAHRFRRLKFWPQLRYFLCVNLNFILLRWLQSQFSSSEIKLWWIYSGAKRNHRRNKSRPATPRWEIFNPVSAHRRRRVRISSPGRLAELL
jgi:hypothetical protein